MCHLFSVKKHSFIAPINDILFSVTILMNTIEINRSSQSDHCNKCFHCSKIIKLSYFTSDPQLDVVLGQSVF